MNSFSDQLKVVGGPTDEEIEKRKAEAVKEFRKELDAITPKGIERATALDAFFQKEAKPFVAEVKAANIAHQEISHLLWEIEKLFEVPNQIRNAVSHFSKLGWQHIRQTVYVDEVDRVKRATLIREYGAFLSPGDVEGTCRRYMRQVGGYIQALADCAAISERAAPVAITAPAERPEPLSINTKFNARQKTV